MQELNKEISNQGLGVVNSDDSILDEAELDEVAGGFHNCPPPSNNNGDNSSNGDGSVKIGSFLKKGGLKNITDGTSNTLMFGE